MVEALDDSELDSRFEIHNVTPSVGSEMGGALVSVRGVGFGSPSVTSQLMVAALGTLGDHTKWSDTEVWGLRHGGGQYSGGVDQGCSPMAP